MHPSETPPRKNYAFTLFALHGNGGGGFRYERCIPFFSDDVLFLNPTLPGFAGVPSRNFRTMKHFSDYIASEIDQTPHPRFLLGHGIGGSMAMDLVQRHARKIDGLILHAPVGTRLEKRIFPIIMRPEFMRKLVQNIFSGSLTRPLIKKMIFSENEEIPEEYLTRFFEEYRSCSVFGQMFDLITHDWFRSLKPAKIPTVLLWGAKERILKTDHIKDYQQLFPEAQTRIVPDWDHFPMVEQPRAYASELEIICRELIRKD